MLNASKPFGEKGTGFLSGKFREARTRLTLVYVCILAFILLLSSGSIYSLFSRQLNTRLARFHPRIAVILPNDFISPNPADVRTDLIDSLLIVNGFLLLAAGVASYWLAGLTLEPIQEAYERQRRFLSDASHELRTPLAILQTDLENELIATPAKPAARHQIESHLEEVGRMSQLVGNLLLLSRLDERTEARHQTTRLHVGDVIEESADRLQSIAQRYDVTIRIEPLDKDAQFITNKELLMQALS
nr:HAMP domain-containing histidine kinase [Patescibacteria group bacterium]